MINYTPKPNYKSENGFTLLEVLISLVIIALVAAIFLPMAGMVTQVNYRNKVKLNATMLAEGQIEAIKALLYEKRTSAGVIDTTAAQIGTVGGNPAGLIPQNQTKVINGVTYNIETRITWKIVGSNTTAFKQIEIVVSAPSLPGKAAQQQADIQSVMAREGEVSIVPGGSLLAYAVRNNAAQPGVKIKINPSGSSTPVTTSYTDDTGGVLFAELTTGTSYAVDVDPSEGWMVKPVSATSTGWNASSQIAGPIVLNANCVAPTPFTVDYPYNLSFQLLDADGNPVDKSSLYAVMVATTDSGSLLTMEMKVTDLENIKLWPTWTYDFKFESNMLALTYLYVRSLAYTQYSTYPDSSIYSWDGTFSVPSASTSLTKTLTVKSGKPVISLADPVSGRYQINITAKPSNAVIYYTTDGSTPSVSSTIYNNSTPPTVTPASGSTVTIKALAVVTGLLMNSDVTVYSKIIP